MDFFDTFKEKATVLAQTGVATSKRLAEIAKLKVANMGEEDTIETNNDRIAELKATAEAEGEVIDVTPVSVEDAKEEEEISPEDIADEEAPAQEEEAPKTEE